MTAKNDSVNMKLTLGDTEDFENIAGIPFGALTNLDPATMSAKTMIALAYVLKRKQNPDITLEEVKQLPSDALNDLVGIGDADPE